MFFFVFEGDWLWVVLVDLLLSFLIEMFEDDSGFDIELY